MPEKRETQQILSEIDKLLEELKNASVLKHLEAYVTPHAIIIPSIDIPKKELFERIKKHIH